MRKIVTGNTQQKGFVGRTLALKMGQSNLRLMLDFPFATAHLKCFTKRRGPTSRRWAGALHPHKPKARHLSPSRMNCCRKEEADQRHGASAPWYSQRHRMVDVPTALRSSRTANDQANGN